MKAASWITRVLTCLLAFGGLILFFANFVTFTSAEGSITLTGSQLAFGGGYKIDGGQSVELYKSMYFTFAFIFAAAGALMSALSFKFKGTKYAAPVFEIVSAIALLVYYVSRVGKFVDYRPFTSATDFAYTIFPLITLLVLFAGTIAGVASLLTSDYVEVAASKGAKKPILVRVVRYFRDFRGEVKKVVWPTKKTLIKNVIVVVVMCLIIGGFIWLIDFGLASLLNVIYK